MSARQDLLRKLKSNIPPQSSRRASRDISEADFIPEPWNNYFDSYLDIETSRGTFRTYHAGVDGATTLICLHGGGQSSLTWAVFTQEILKVLKVKVICIDLRGHGNSRVPGDVDLSMENFVDDVCEVMDELFEEANIPQVVLIGHSLGGAIAIQIASPSCRMNTIITSLIVIDIVEGSALASLSHMNNVLQSRPKGFVSIKDAIAWSATKSQTTDFTALRVSVPGQLKQIDNNEPATAYVEEEKDKWLEQQKSLKNMSGDAENSSSGQQNSAFVMDAAKPGHTPRPESATASVSPDVESILEDDEEESESSTDYIKSPKKDHKAPEAARPPNQGPCGMPPPCQSNTCRSIPIRTHQPHRSIYTSKTVQPGVTQYRYTWRVNLHASAPYWPEWFKGMSAKFLETHAKKLIVLCGEDRLDTTLSTGHMQGKFQLVLIRSGHHVQEDRPVELSEIVSKYLTRQKVAEELDLITPRNDPDQVKRTLDF